jgi:hypothetical protein
MGPSSGSKIRRTEPVKKRGRGTGRSSLTFLRRSRKASWSIGHALADTVFAEREKERKEIIEALKENHAETRAVLNEWVDRTVAEGKMTAERAAEVRREIDKIQFGCETGEP